MQVIVQFMEHNLLCSESVWQCLLADKNSRLRELFKQLCKFDNETLLPVKEMKIKNVFNLASYLLNKHDVMGRLQTTLDSRGGFNFEDDIAEFTFVRCDHRITEIQHESGVKVQLPYGLAIPPEETLPSLNANGKAVPARWRLIGVGSPYDCTLLGPNNRRADVSDMFLKLGILCPFRPKTESMASCEYSWMLAKGVHSSDPNTPPPCRVRQPRSSSPATSVPIADAGLSKPPPSITRPASRPRAAGPTSSQLLACDDDAEPPDDPSAHPSPVTPRESVIRSASPSFQAANSSHPSPSSNPRGGSCKKTRIRLKRSESQCSALGDDDARNADTDTEFEKKDKSKAAEQPPQPQQTNEAEPAEPAEPAVAAEQPTQPNQKQTDETDETVAAAAQAAQPENPNQDETVQPEPEQDEDGPQIEEME